MQNGIMRGPRSAHQRFLRLQIEILIKRVDNLLVNHKPGWQVSVLRVLLPTVRAGSGEKADVMAFPHHDETYLDRKAEILEVFYRADEMLSTLGTRLKFTDVSGPQALE